MKTCTICGETKPLTEFHKRHDYDGKPRASAHRGECKPCRNLSQLWQRYNIEPEEYYEMVAAQSGRCAICGNACPVFSRLSVDHCHVTGTIRDLLCSPCNQILGLALDNPDRLRAAADYLEKHIG